MTKLLMPSLAERPDLTDEVRGLSRFWPDFMLQDPTAVLMDRLFGGADTEAFPDWQFAVLAEENPDVVLGRVLSVPVPWPADVAELPSRGWDAAIEAALELAVRQRGPLSACALEITLSDQARGQGLSRTCIAGLKEACRRRGMQALFAPVRPTTKSSQPLLPLTEFLAAKDPTGGYRDPWLRTHVQLGGEVIGVASLSMTITGTFGQWKEWTGIDFGREPGGQVILAGALAPVLLNHVEGVAAYIEPNVWVRHRLT
jgi:GNAT superfamily N-acetyltransferase